MKVLWITGNSGAGKTYLARILAPGKVWLDGDAMRKVWPGLTFTKADRWEQNMRIARLCRLLIDQGFSVVVSSICPYQELRDEIRKLLGESVTFVFLAGGKQSSEEYPYEGRQRVEMDRTE